MSRLTASGSLSAARRRPPFRARARTRWCRRSNSCSARSPTRALRWFDLGRFWESPEPRRTLRRRRSETLRAQTRLAAGRQSRGSARASRCHAIRNGRGSRKRQAGDETLRSPRKPGLSPRARNRAGGSPGAGNLRARTFETKPDDAGVRLQAQGPVRKPDSHGPRASEATAQPGPQPKSRDGQTP